MMKFQFLLILALVWSVSIQKAQADSPLTSTAIAKAYEHEPMVQKADEAKGSITLEIMDYLSDPSAPIAVKMAVINKLGWKFGGKENATNYFIYLQDTKGYTNRVDFLAKGTGDELLCMAYLRGLDNYFDVAEATVYADYALKKNPGSYTYQIIAALINAQHAMDSDWCEVYMLTDRVRSDKSLNLDMNEAARKIIFDYMDLYQDSCE